MKLGKFITVFATAILLLITAANAEPLSLTEDLTDTIRIDLNEKAAYIYTFAYPQADERDPSAELINTFYQHAARDAAEFEVPMNADYYRGQDLQENITVEISYQVTCNNDDFFSVLIHTYQGDLETYAGHTFSRKGLKPGSSVALPYLLGLLENGESDTWLQERQTGKADQLVREMIWERLREMDAELYPDLEEESLEYGFFPEEDFYLDQEGNPVFYLQPGFAEDSGSLLVFPVAIEEILDEM